METEVKETIKLNSIEKIYKLNNIAKDFKTDIDLCSKNNPRHKIDAKSIMGIFALDLSDELEVILTNGSDEVEKNEFINAMKQFVA